VLSHAFTTTECVPFARATEVERVFEFTVIFDTLSTYRRIAVMVRPATGVAAAANETGELTVAFAVGVQMLTVPAVPEGAHCALAPNATRNKIPSRTVDFRSALEPTSASRTYLC
jgi:hypothetical protein